jgi:hypothetical protein
VPGKLGMAAHIIAKGGTLMPPVNDKLTYVLTGDGASIQSFRKLLREQGVSNNQIITKAYWIAGKKGL